MIRRRPMRPEVTLLVLAKSPVAGRVKTRLTPDLTPSQACALAAAALDDTLAVVAAAPARRRVLVLDGEPGPWVPPGFDVVPQGDGDLAARLAAAFAQVDGAAFLVGMDTPQLTAADLWPGLGRAGAPDAVIGLCEDGGFWGIGMREPRPQVFAGVPMSTHRTGELQRESLRQHGFEVAELRRLRDVDTVDDARAVASLAPGTRFAARLRQLESGAAGSLPARATAMS